MAGKLICQRSGCGGPRQVALLLEWESTRAGKSPMRAFTGLEVCRPCAWKIKHPTEVFQKEFLEKLRESIAQSGIGSPQKTAAVRYCGLNHPDFLKYKRMRGMH